MSHNPFAASTEATKAITTSVRSGGVPASALHEGTIKAAYLIQNNWDAKNIDLALHIELPSGYEYKMQKTVLKDGSPMALNTKTKKQELLYTYEQISHVVGAAVEGKTLGDMFDSITPRKIELYDFEARKDVLTEVKMVDDLVGKKLLIGLQRKIANKRQQVDGEWVDLPERKETLEFGVAANIDDRRTFTEFNDGVSPEDATDVDKWEKMNVGKDWNAYKEVAATAGVPAGVAASAGTTEVHDFSA